MTLPSLFFLEARSSDRAPLSSRSDISIQNPSLDTVAVDLGLGITQEQSADTMEGVYRRCQAKNLYPSFFS